MRKLSVTKQSARSTSKNSDPHRFEDLVRQQLLYHFRFDAPQKQPPDPGNNQGFDTPLRSYPRIEQIARRASSRLAR